MKKTKNAPGLRELQTRLRASIISDRDAPAWIANLPPLSPGKRLEVYRAGWWLRLSESLGEDYPHLRRVLGARAFERLLNAYLKAHPPASHTLIQAGYVLPEYLGRWRDPARRPWHVELARLERALFRSFHARDSKAFDLAVLSSLSPARAAGFRLRLQPSAELVDSRWDLSPVLNGGRSAKASPKCYLVFRKGWLPEWRELEPAPYRLLRSAAAPRGARLGEWAASGKTEWIAWMSEWAREGIIGND